MHRYYTESRKQEALAIHDQLSETATTREIADMLGIHPNTFRGWLRERRGFKRHSRTLDAAQQVVKTAIETPAIHNCVTTNDADIALKLVKELHAKEIIKADGLYQITY